jgi:hypothetical protein
MTDPALVQLQFVFDLPQTLQMCVDRRENEQAVAYYTQARDVLTQHTSIPSFKTIAAECEVIMKSLRQRLREAVSAEVCPAGPLAVCVCVCVCVCPLLTGGQDAHVACEAVTLLARLREPVPELRRQFLHSRAAIMQQRLLKYSAGPMLKAQCAALCARPTSASV